MAVLDPPPEPAAAPAPTRAGPNGYRRFWRPAVLVFGVAISAAVAGIVHSMLIDERQAQDQAARQSLSAGLQSHIDRKLGFVRFMRGLYDSSDFVSAEEFKRFAEIDPAVQEGQWWFTVAWAPRESPSPLLLPRDRAGQSGFAAGDVFPVAYVEPVQSAQPLIANAAADPAESAAMRRAAVLQQMTLSEPRLLTGHGGMQIRAYMPLFKDGNAASGDLQGFLIASIALDGLFDDFLQNVFPDPDVSLRIYDGKSLVFSRGPEDAMRSQTVLTVGNQHWRLEMGRAGQAAASFWVAAMVFVIGLALTAMLYLHLLRTESEYLRISREVGRATAELAGANARLAERSSALETVADDLRRTSQEAQLANAAKTVFLANMSHELRTPLNAIIGFSELIGHQTLGEQSPRYFEYARDIEASGRYLLSIIEDLLDMSRIELGQVRLVEEAISLEDVVGGVVKFVAHRAQERRIGIDVVGLAGLPRVHADGRSLRQALINLLINAIKFSPPNSNITVSGEFEAGSGIALSVQDNGPGIKTEEISSVFEPFWQGEAYRRKARDGVGLGLAITKRLIEAHGGAVALISGEGLGTRAVIRLPSSRVLRGRPQLSVISGGNTAA